MKKIFMVVGIFFATLALIAIIGIGISIYFGTGYDKTSKEYVDRVVPEIVKDWDIRTVLKYSSPELLKSFNENKDRTITLFNYFSDNLGPLKKYNGCKGDSNINYLINKGKTISAFYKAGIDCEKGKGVIEIRLVNEQGEWKISGFHVDSDNFFPKTIKNN